MGEHKDTRPAAERIAAHLRTMILSGDMVPGEQLPVTGKLIEQYGTSNVTIQRALNILKNEGYLEGQKGRGVYVRSRAPQTIVPASYMAPSTDGEPYRWVAEAAKRSQRGGSKILEVSEVQPPARVARALGLLEGGLAVMRHRVMLLDDEPVELARSYYPPEVALGTRLADRRKIPGGSPTLLAEMGLRPCEQADEIVARPATTEEYVALELPGDVPVLETFRVVYSEGRRPVEVSVLVKGCHLYKLGYHLPIH